MRIVCVLAVLCAAGCSTLSGVRNPTVEVLIDHPPGVGVHITRVAFAPPAGGCSVAVVTAVTEDLLSANVDVAGDVTVVANQADLGERKVREALSIPRELLLSLRDIACRPDHDMNVRTEKRTRTKTREGEDGEEEKYEETYWVTITETSTRFDLDLSVRATDLATGDVVAAWDINQFAADSNRGTDYVPDHPPVGPLRQRAVRYAQNELSRWLLPWSETGSLTFYDAKECEMDLTFAQVDADDLDAAGRAAARSVEVCGGEDARFEAAAHYNAGMVEFIGGNLEAAIHAFDTARRIDPENDHVAEALGEATRAQELREEIRAIEAFEQHGDPDAGALQLPE